MTKPKRIYLAGPEAFFPAEEHQAIVAEKKRLLRESGGQLFVAEQPGEHRFFSAELFRRCVQALACAWTLKKVNLSRYSRLLKPPVQ